MAPKKVQTYPVKSINSQQDIANDLYLLQIEYLKLAKGIIDLYQRTLELLNFMEMLKSENQTLRQELALNPQLQQVQGRILQTEHIVQEIQNFGIRKTEQTQWLNDPMEIEQQLPTTENPYRKILIPLSENNDLLVLQAVRTQSKKLFPILIKQNNENQSENIFRINCNQEGKIYRKKILQLNKQAPNIQRAINEFNKK